VIFLVLIGPSPAVYAHDAKLAHAHEKAQKRTTMPAVEQRKERIETVLKPRLPLPQAIPSSFIADITYDAPSLTMTYWLKSGANYDFPFTSYAVFLQAYNGLAACRTNDPTGQNRWTLGKFPSRGAFFNRLRGY